MKLLFPKKNVTPYKKPFIVNSILEACIYLLSSNKRCLGEIIPFFFAINSRIELKTMKL